MLEGTNLVATIERIAQVLALGPERDGAPRRQLNRGAMDGCGQISDGPPCNLALESRDLTKEGVGIEIVSCQLLRRRSFNGDGTIECEEQPADERHQEKRSSQNDQKNG